MRFNLTGVWIGMTQASEMVSFMIEKSLYVAGGLTVAAGSTVIDRS